MTDTSSFTTRSTARARRRRQRITTLAVGVVMVALAALMWPTRAGGRVTYVMTYGTSMEPRFHAGDLALVLPTSDYRVGQIVAYHSTTLDTVVMHRIMAIRHGHYIFKGDHNSWTDPDRPTQHQLLGKLWLRIPHGAVLLVALRNMAIAGAILALVFFAFPPNTSEQRSKTAPAQQHRWRRFRVGARATGFEQRLPGT